MTQSPLQKALVSSVCISGALFAVATAPLMLYRSQLIEVQVQNRSVLATEVNALAGPYLGLAGAFSAALGLSALGVTGWRLAASQSENEKAKSTELKRNLLVCQAELERVKFSDARLKAQGLDTFLEPQSVPATAPVPASTYHITSTASPEPVLVGHGSSRNPQNGLASSGSAALLTVSDSQNGKASAGYAALANGLVAQSIVDRATSLVNDKAPQTQAREASNSSEGSPKNKLDALLNQLQDLATQVEDMRAGGSVQQMNPPA